MSSSNSFLNEMNGLQMAHSIYYNETCKTGAGLPQDGGFPKATQHLSIFRHGCRHTYDAKMRLTHHNK